jgi:hypothetical protein
VTKSALRMRPAPEPVEVAGLGGLGAKARPVPELVEGTSLEGIRGSIPDRYLSLSKDQYRGIRFEANRYLSLSKVPVSRNQVRSQPVPEPVEGTSIAESGFEANRYLSLSKVPVSRNQDSKPTGT